MRITGRLSTTISVARALALVSIVSAHALFVSQTPQAFVSFYSKLGTVGVAAYFMISGFLYFPKNYAGFGKMLKNKARSIGIPWLVLGSVGYLYNAFGNKSFSAAAYLEFMLGKNSYLYFLTMLFFCFVVCYFVNSKLVLLAFAALSVLSLELTAFGVLQPVIAALHITNYLNIFNWLGFFAFGRLVQTINADRIFQFLKTTRVAFLALFVVLLVVFLITGVNTTYFSFVGWGYELIGAMAIFGAATYPALNNRVFKKVSNDSFSVYLIHLMVISLLNKACFKLFSLFPPLQLIQNLLVIAVSVLLIELALLLARALKLNRLAGAVFAVKTQQAVAPNKNQ